MLVKRIRARRFLVVYIVCQRPNLANVMHGSLRVVINSSDGSRRNCKVRRIERMNFRGASLAILKALRKIIRIKINNNKN